VQLLILLKKEMKEIMNRRNFIKNLGLGAIAMSSANIITLEKNQPHITEVANNITKAFNKKCFVEVVDIWNGACETLSVSEVKVLHSYPDVGSMVIKSVKNLEINGFLNIEEGDDNASI